MQCHVFWSQVEYKIVCSIIRLATTAFLPKQVLHDPIFVATCLAMALRNELQVGCGV